MSFGLTEEQRKSIKRAIRYNIVEKKRGIISILRKNDLVNHLDVRIDREFGKDIDHGKIGIKSYSINSIDFEIDYVAEIKMVLRINKIAIDGMSSRGEVVEDIIFRGIYSEINRFSNQLEQFILRGTDTEDKFWEYNLQGDENFNCFFSGNNKITTLKLNECGGILSAINTIERNLRNTGNSPPFILMSDSETHRKGMLYNVQNGVDLTTSIKEHQNNIDEWFDLIYNADNERKDDYKLVCIPKCPNPQDPPFRLIEKSPLDLSFRYNGGLDHQLNYVLDLSWCGALEIIDKNAIQRVKLIF